MSAPKVVIHHGDEHTDFDEEVLERGIEIHRHRYQHGQVARPVSLEDLYEELARNLGRDGASIHWRTSFRWEANTEGEEWQSEEPSPWYRGRAALCLAFVWQVAYITDEEDE